MVTKSVFSHVYLLFRQLLVQARKDAGLTQAELAAKLNRPQSYVSKYESGERRLDVIEFLEVARSLGFDAATFIRVLQQQTDANKRAD